MLVRMSSWVLSLSTLYLLKFCLILERRILLYQLRPCKNLQLIWKKVDTIDIPIVIPSGEIVQCSKRYLDVPIEIEGVQFNADLIEFELGDLEIILGMDWLKK